MKLTHPQHAAPSNASDLRQIKPVVCYAPETLPAVDHDILAARRAQARKTDEILVRPRDAGCIEVPAGGFFRIVSVEGPQVGDLNLWHKDNLEERFYSGKTRALHGTHLSTGDRMWSSFPNLRPLATITDDTLDWYGFDSFGGSVHDVIGTRCDPYTQRLLADDDYHYCCHSNLTRALAGHTGLPLHQAEMHVHDVLNVFMCTGFTRDTGQYFMKASPVRPGDYLEFLAEVDLLVGLSACPGGDCSAEHSSDEAACHPLLIEVYDPGEAARAAREIPAPSPYDRTHGSD
ncbi:MAG: urea carboxylase-associated family protein [Ruegeria sp.]